MTDHRPMTRHTTLPPGIGGTILTCCTCGKKAAYRYNEAGQTHTDGWRYDKRTLPACPRCAKKLELT